MAETILPSADAATLMDRMYRHQRHIYDLTRKFYLLGRDTLIDELDPPPGGNVLEIGCGTGRNLIVAARRYPKVRFFGLDISNAMLATARAEILRHALDGRIEVAQARTQPLSIPWPCSASRGSTGFSSPTRCR